MHIITKTNTIMTKFNSFKSKWLLVPLVLFTLNVSNAWGGTSTLTSAIISSGTTGNSYASYSFNADGKTWNAYAIHKYHSNQTSSVYYLQIKAYASSTAYYVQIPTMPGKINSISMIVSSTGQPKTGGSNTATFYFSASNSSTTAASGLSANPVTAVSGTGGSSVTLDCSPLNLTGGYITASGGTRIWEIEVTYCISPTSLTNGTITSNTAHLSWSDASNTGSYEVYRSTSNTAPAYDATPTTTVSATSVDLGSLTASTTYYWWVRSKCSNTNKSAWVAGSSFTTSSAASCSADVAIGTASLNGSFL